jgi:hypothetical protein
MIRINGESATYYTQRNNLRIPGKACGVTSIVNALAAIGAKLPDGEGQPEDRLYDFILADAECRKLFATKPSKNPSPINEWQDILALGASRWLWLPGALSFNETATAQGMLDRIIRGGACCVTGAFPAPDGKVFHHTVALIGAEYEGAPLAANVRRWVIRDSWGDHRTLYRVVDGALVDLTPDEFRDILNTGKTDRKWCIYVCKGDK